MYVDGYKKVSFVSNSNGKTVRDVIIGELKDCSEMFMSVAFITSGGLVPFLGYLKEMERKHIKGRILTTDYLLFSDPRALDLLNSLSNLEVRMYRTQSSGVGFHTKGYLFHHDNGDLKILVGSSNLTQNAMSKNYEWNTMLASRSDAQYARDMETEFNDIWSSSVCYSDCRDEYRREYSAKSSDRALLKKLASTLDLSVSKVVEPNAMQRLFSENVYGLVRSGEKRALLISATGTGKTFASAFAVRNLFAKSQLLCKRLLFLSHREQINIQAMSSYRRIFGENYSMVQLSGSAERDVARLQSADFVFSTIQTLSKDDVRANLFEPEHFGVIILDECHRSGAQGYRKVIDYFKPDLLLGMSASPERGDGFDVYQQFDHNIACEIRLQTALDNDLLCPFHYFGIQDIVLNDSHVDTRQFNMLVSDERVRQIIMNAEYYGFSGTRVKGLVFCSSKTEGKELSRKFNETGRYRTVFLCGENSQQEREVAISLLTASDDTPDRLDYIFTVDIFNEGVDIPEINQVIMLRPTESAIIFVQQLGRGLRKCEGKEYVVVIDFIANYRNNYLIPVALSGDRTGNKDNIRRHLIEGNAFLSGASTVYFDEVSKSRIFNSIDSAKMNRTDLLKKEFAELKNKLGRRPALVEFDKYQALDPMRIIGCCGSYHNFLVKYDSLVEAYSDAQNSFMTFICEKFASGKRIHEIELLRVVLGGAADIREEWESRMASHLLPVTGIVAENVLNVMSGVFYAIGASKTKYEAISFISQTSDGKWKIAEKFASCIADTGFRRDVEEVLDFAEGRYKSQYSSRMYGCSFVIGQKYTYEDVCRLLCWEKNVVALNIGGYKYDRRTQTFPVFINYDKADDISDTTKYEDRFVDNSHIIAISKSKRTLESSDVETMMHSEELGVRMELFIRKNKDDDESLEFYYLGPMRYDGFSKQFVMPRTEASAVELRYALEVPVKDGLYEYLNSVV